MQIADVRTKNLSAIEFFKAAVDADDTVLAIGTKHGEKVRDIAGRIIGVDIASAQFPTDSPVEFALADGTALPFKTDSIDFVYCDQVLEHVSETGPLVSEAARVLAPDGVAYFGFPNRLSLRRPHSEVPRYYSLLPRAVGSRLAPYLLDEDSSEYYDRSLAPLSPASARWHFHRNFEQVVYPIRIDPASVTDSRPLRRLVWWANTVATVRPLCWVGEQFWPNASYLCRGPKDH